jgi:hypothetical protein
MQANLPALSKPDFNQHLLLALAAIGALVSTIATGHLVGVRNDIYFLPILTALYDEPQFASDLYIQSLRHYSSGFWQLLSGVEKHLDSYWLLLFLSFLSRMLTFAGFLACSSLLGIRRWKHALFLTTLLCATSFLRGQSLAGDGGLFINYFTHSEIDNGLTLLIFYMLLCRWLIAAIATAGLVFFINAFIGVWDAAMILVVATAMASTGTIRWRTLLLGMSIGTALASVLAAPVLINLFSNPDFGKPPDFDYFTYLQQFWPYHFIFRESGLQQQLGLAAMVASAAAAFAALGTRSYFFQIGLASFSAIYVIGVIVPYVTHNALILNLHLLRVSTMLQLLFVLACLVLATKWWFSKQPLYSNFLGPVLVILMCAPIKMTTIQPALHAAAALLIILAALSQAIVRKIPKQLFNPQLRLNYLAITIVAVGFFAIVANNMISNARATEWLQEWKTIGNWAKTNTSPTDIFLVATWNFINLPQQTQPSPDASEAILNSGAFESIAHRAVWIDFRQGAAVMWSPSYYAQWHQRVAEVASLASSAGREAYARANGIGYLIERCKPEPNRPPVFSTRRLCVYTAS